MKCLYASSPQCAIDDTWSPPVCEDKSDQVIKSETTCSSISSEYLTRYQETFCQDWGYKVQCKYGEAWFSKQTDSLRTDPHNCQGSCSEEERSKGLDCLSCTNPDYFQCPEDGTCLNPDLKCDGHPQCSDLSDEKNCYDDYIRRGIIRDSATIQCKSKNYPGKNNSRVSVGQTIKISFEQTCYFGELLAIIEQNVMKHMMKKIVPQS